LGRERVRGYLRECKAKALQKKFPLSCGERERVRGYLKGV